MKLGYDNLEDAKTKLVGTFCMYGGKAFTIKLLQEVAPGKYHVTGSEMLNGREVTCDIDDPKFNCSDYNIGYLNRMSAAAWFYRVPMKQYKQGLRHDQVSMKCSHRGFYGVEFRAGKPLGQMLENIYPTMSEAAKLLKDQEASIVAFGRNFAMTLDTVHADYIIEYKGGNVGFTHDLETFKLMKEHEHLYEALKEAAQSNV